MLFFSLYLWLLLGSIRCSVTRGSSISSSSPLSPASIAAPPTAAIVGQGVHAALIQQFAFNAPASSLSTTTATSSAATTEDGQRSGSSADEIQLQDLTLSTLALAVTVDGFVHGINRETGQWLWTLHDDNGAALGGYSKEERDSRGDAGQGLGGGALVKGVGRRKRRGTGPAEKDNNTSSPSPSTPPINLDLTIDEEARADGEIKGGATSSGGRGDDLEDEEEDEVYIIEPNSAGDIYLYSRSPAPGSLQKLPLSMLQLVALSPFTFPSDSSRMFAGRKETKLVGVDLKSGRLVGVFGSGAGWCEWDEKSQGRVRTDEECDEDIQRRPEDLLYIARTEYHLSIYSKAPYALLQTLTYTTYSSSSLTSSLQSRWTATPDSRYLQPMHDGSLMCFLSGVPGLQWTMSFDVPVVAVFDIALAKATAGENAQPIMFEQPHPSPVEGLPVVFENLQSLPETTFIGIVEGGLFAMSRDHFPLVAFAPVNGVEKEIISGTRSTTRKSTGSASSSDREGSDGMGDAVGAGTHYKQNQKPKCIGLACLVGAHRLRPSAITPVENTIGGRPERLGIEAPPSSASTTPSNSPSPLAPEQLRPSNPDHSPPLPNRSVLALMYRPVQSLSIGNSALLFSVVLAILGSIYLRKLSSAEQKSMIQLRQSLKLIITRWTKAETDPTILAPAVSTHRQPKKRRLSKAISPQAQPFPPSTTASILPSSSLNIPDFVSSAILLNGSPLALDVVAPIPLLQASLSSSPILREVSKDLPPLPAINGDEDADGDSDAENGVIGDTPRRKGRKRRGKKIKKNNKVGDEAGLVSPLQRRTIELFPDETTESVQVQLESLSLADVLSDEGMEIEESLRVDPHLIGGLSVSETILGYGSHGTIVLRGEFQGRAVAVKRLLKDFVTIATHEVALLQESDDHPNVIRYFCKEQRGTFLYIALELCPASLFELIDQPNAFPELVKDLDAKKALRQIASGIRHLHKLKIVHRDIKPQNILVAKSHHTGSGVRMLISDFGLCKKLDMDESSFQQTVDHAAGSFGYRAPEVLRGHVDPNDGAVTASNSTDGSSVGSRSPTGNNKDPSMRLTRSIDIFSLGCIFYYVLTGGEHPFGGRYEREMNILLGKASLERLDGLGEEALEVQDAIMKMVATDPRERPTAESVLLHPFFWNAQKRLLFICDASDRFEIMERDPPEVTLISLEEHATSIVGDDWSKSIDRTLLDNLGKYRKYDGKSVRDLLRVLRNKKHHYQDLPDSVRRNLGDLPGGFLTYFTARFPRLLLHVFDVVGNHLSDEAMFKSTFSVGEDES